MATTYAQAADLTAYVSDSGVTLPAGAALDRLINRAERDIDLIVGPWAQTKTVGIHALPVGTLNVQDTTRFPTSGNVTVDGKTLAYTGLTETTLTGVTGGTGTVLEGAYVTRRSTSGLKFDPIAQLTTAEQGALNRATCAQAEYRVQMSESFFIEAQFEQVRGPDFSQTGQLPKIGPKVYQELEGYGLLNVVMAR